MTNRKLTASEKLKIKRKEHYDSLSPAQKKEYDRIMQESWSKRNAEAQKNKYSTGPEMKAPDKKMGAVQLKHKAVQLKRKAVKKKKKK